MKTLTVVAISITMLALPVAAYAQGNGRGIVRREEPVANPEKKRAEDKAYNDALSRVAPKEYDPWQGMREKEPAEKPSAPQKKPRR